MSAQAPPPRTKPSIEIRADEIDAALYAKFARAQEKLGAVREAEQPRMTPHLNAYHDVQDFLTAARGIHGAAKTHGSAAWPEGEFAAWRTRWESALEPGDRELWDYMTDQRDAVEHGVGPDLAPVMVELPPEQSNGSFIWPGIPGGVPWAMSWKGVFRFNGYPGQTAGTICAAYLQLCQRFREDFLREVAARRASGP